MAKIFGVHAKLAETDLIDAGVITLGAVTTPPTKGTTLVDKVQYARKGDSAYFRYQYKQTTGGTVGSGDYLYTLPASLQFDSTKVSFITTAIASLDSVDSSWGMRGDGACRITASGASGAGVFIIPFDATRFRVMFVQWYVDASPQNSAYFQIQAGLEFAFEFVVPISGWSSLDIVPATP